MSVEYFVRFEGKCYDVGTKLKFYIRNMGTLCQTFEPYVGTIEKFDKNMCFIKGDDGNTYCIYTTSQEYSNNYVKEIIKPVYYVTQCNTSYIHSILSWKFEIILTWYILIMVIGVIFQERLLIWVCATLLFGAYIFKK